METQYEAVIGLEVHAQLLTKSKAFSWSPNEYGAAPNSNTDAVTLAMPGTLPVINRKLIDYTLRMGLATNCKIRPLSTFSRKNYFYPDLPKGYQISQYEDPICFDGKIEIELDNGNRKAIGITRIHMEEDSGKSIHDMDIETLVDLNRAGTPLIEIVSEPDIRSAQEAYKYLMQIRQTVMYLGICNGIMEEGALRCDANISVRPVGQEKFGTKVEVKNLNSFRNVERAIEYEIQRQIDANRCGEKINQETRMWDANHSRTRPMRSKEMAHDYRYFPEPDLLPVRISQEWLEQVAEEIPELPMARRDRFISEYGIPAYDANIFVDDRELADYYENACRSLIDKNHNHFKLVSNWVMTEILRIKSQKNISISQVSVKPEHISELVELITSGEISNRIAKEIFPEIELGKSPSTLVEEKGLKQNSDTTMIEELVKKVIEENPDSVEKYRAGRNNLLGFFVGQIMKQTQGKANPQIVSDLVTKYLNEK